MKASLQLQQILFRESTSLLSLLLQNKFYFIMSKSSTDVSRTKLFNMDIQTRGPLIAHKQYSISPKYQKIIDEEIWLLKGAGCISKCLSLWTTLVIIFPKKPDHLHYEKQQMSLVLDYNLLNK